MDACAHALDQAAAALDEHARAVHRRIAELEAIPAAIGHAGAGLAHRVGAGISRATHWIPG
jgi:Zn-dependent alcohol dehydrogenase